MQAFIINSLKCILPSIVRIHINIQHINTIYYSYSHIVTFKFATRDIT